MPGLRCSVLIGYCEAHSSLPNFASRAPQIATKCKWQSFDKTANTLASCLFTARQKGVGTPVGDRVSELQGPVMASDFLIDGEQFLQQTGLSAWKSQQYQSTGTLDLFSLDWVVAFLQNLRQKQTNNFSGLLSALYLGDKVIAIHFGIRSRDVLGWWFPSYDHQFSKYSPGAILSMRVLQTAETEGIKRVDLRQGDERYKTSFMTGAYPVIEGMIAGRSLNGLLHRGWIQTRNWAQSSSMGRVPLAVFRRLRNWIIKK
jgi:hypothetical protein